jgi:hypothetical protein
MPAWIRGMVWLSGRDIARSTIEMMRSDGYVDAWRTVHLIRRRSPASRSRYGIRTCAGLCLHARGVHFSCDRV